MKRSLKEKVEDHLNTNNKYAIWNVSLTLKPLLKLFKQELS